MLNIKNVFATTLVLLSIFSHKLIAEENYDKYAQCETCTDLQMENKAKVLINEDGAFDVLIYSLQNKKLNAYRIFSIVENEPGLSIIRKRVSQLSIPEELNNDYGQFVDALEMLKTDGRIDLPASICTSATCLNDIGGLASVSLFLRSQFNLSITFHVVLNALFDSLIDDYEVEVCFSDGECVELTLLNAFSSFSFAPTSGGSSAAGSDSDYYGNNNTSITLTCTAWTEYYSDGVFLFSICNKYRQTSI